MNKQQRTAAALHDGQEFMRTGKLPAGAKKLGRGVYALVFASHGFAVKVQGWGKGTWPRTKNRSRSRYLEGSNSAFFLRAIHDKELTGRHFPEVYALEEQENGRFIAVMELLGKGRHAWVHVKHAWYLIHGDTGLIRGKAKQQTTLRRALRLLERAGFDVDDIHSGNVMLRGDTIVLTDVVL